MRRSSASFVLLITVLLLIPSAAHAQKEHNIWYFGYGAGLDFNSGGPVPLTNGRLSSDEGCAVICDPRTGELLFYTNGVTVWDKSHAIMQGGVGLNGHSSSTQSALIVPVPGSSTAYYIFTSGAITGLSSPDQYQKEGVQYSVVDMKHNNGYGAVVGRNIPLLAPAAEKLAAVRHCNGMDVWVVAVEWGTNLFHAYRVTSSGVPSRSVVSPTGFMVTDALTPTGYLEFSPDGRTLAMATDGNRTGRVDLYDFDANTGTISGGRQLVFNRRVYGICFSPDNTKLYVGQQDPTASVWRADLWQYDLTGNTATNVGGMNSFPGAIQIGPDGRLYVTLHSTGSSSIGAIKAPNLAGSACSFDPKFMSPTGGTRPWSLMNIYGLPSQLRRGSASTVDILRDTIICRNGSIQLKATGGTTYLWMPAEGLSCTDCPDPIARPSESTTYTVNILDATGCGTVDRVRIELDDFDLITHDTLICRGDAVVLGNVGNVLLRDHVWTPKEGLNCTDCPAPVARPEQTTVYTLTAVTEMGCTISDSIVVRVNQPPPTDAGPDVIICPGGIAQLLASGGVRYQWWPVADLSCRNCENPTARPQTTTTYFVRAWNEFGCSGIDSVTVFISKPAIDAGRSMTICPGDSALLHATGARSYAWSPAEGLSCVDCPDPIAAPRRTIRYTVIGTDSLGCSGQDTVTVIVGPAIVATAGGDTTLCAGTQVRLSAAGGSRFRWSPSTGLSCDDCPDPIAAPSVTTRYVVEVRGNGSCPPDSAEVTVTVAPLPVAVAGRDTVICTGGSAQLLAAGGAEYRWSPADGLSCADCPDPIARPATTTTYTVVVGNGIDCLDTASVTVSVAAPLIVDAGADQIICAGTGTRLAAKGASRYSWSPSDGLSCADCPDPIASPSSTVTYIVIGSDGTGCTGRDSLTVSVLPRPIVDAGPDVTICGDEGVILQASGGTSYRWNPIDDLSCADCPTTEAHPRKTTDYIVTVSNADGCIATDTVTVTVQEGKSEIVTGIARDHRVLPSHSVRVPVLLYPGIGLNVQDGITFSIRYDHRILRLTNADRASTLLADWTKESEINDVTTGSYSVTLRSPAPRRLNGPDVLMYLHFAGFIGPVDSSEIDLEFSLPDEECIAIRTHPGLIRLDSICALSLRLIEVGLEDFALDANRPNPFNPTTEISFSLGLDGPARLEVFDISGHSVATLIDEPLAAGRYAVTWDASGQPSGMYHCRLSSGTWSRTMVMTLVK